MTDAVNNQSNKPNYVGYGVGGAAIGGIGGAIAKKALPAKYELKPDTFDPSSNKKDKAVVEAMNNTLNAEQEKAIPMNDVFNAATGDSEEAKAIHNYIYGIKDGDKEPTLPENLSEELTTGEDAITKEGIEKVKNAVVEERKAISENLPAKLSEHFNNTMINSTEDISHEKNIINLLNDKKLEEGSEATLKPEEQEIISNNKAEIVKYLKGEKDTLPEGIEGATKDKIGVLKSYSAFMSTEEGIQYSVLTKDTKHTVKWSSILDEEGKVDVEKLKGATKGFTEELKEGVDDASKKAVELTNKAAEALRSSIEGFGKETIKNSRSAVKWAGGIAAVGALIGTAVAFVKGKKGEAKAATEGKDDTKAAEEPKPEEAKAEVKPEEEKKEEPKA